MLHTGGHVEGFCQISFVGFEVGVDFNHANDLCGDSLVFKDVPKCGPVESKAFS